jgi:hypothetical protein
MGDPLAPSEVEGNREGGPGREPWNRRKDVLTVSIEIVMRGFFRKIVRMFRKNLYREHRIR